MIWVPAHFQMLPQLSSKFPCTSQPLSNFVIQDFRPPQKKKKKRKCLVYGYIPPKIGLVGRKTFFTQFLLTLVKSFAGLFYATFCKQI